MLPVQKCDGHSFINALDIEQRSIHFEVVTRRATVDKRCGVHVLRSMVVCGRQRMEIVIVSC